MSKKNKRSLLYVILLVVGSVFCGRANDVYKAADSTGGSESLKALKNELAEADSGSANILGLRSRAEVVRKSTVQLVSLYCKVERLMKPDFGKVDQYTTYVAPPSSTGLFAGVDPNEIKDPKLKREYLAAIDANDKKARISLYQLGLKKISSEIIFRLKRVSLGFGGGGMTSDDFKGLIREIIPDPVIAKTLLKQLDL